MYNMKEVNMAAVQEFNLAFGLMAVINCPRQVLLVMMMYHSHAAPTLLSAILFLRKILQTW